VPPPILHYSQPTPEAFPVKLWTALVGQSSFFVFGGKARATCSRPCYSRHLSHTISTPEYFSVLASAALATFRSHGRADRARSPEGRWALKTGRPTKGPSPPSRWILTLRQPRGLVVVFRQRAEIHVYSLAFSPPLFLYPQRLAYPLPPVLLVQPQARARTCRRAKIAASWVCRIPGSNNPKFLRGPTSCWVPGQGLRVHALCSRDSKWSV